jgi:hypothetical protein
MPAILKYVLFLVTLLCLSACWPLKDDKESSNSSLLPAVNNSLSNESPAGIWMMEMTSSRFDSYYPTGFEDRSTEHSSNHSSYTFLIIDEDANNENSFTINDCLHSQSDIPKIFSSWQLTNATLIRPDITYEEAGSLFPIISISEQGKLHLMNNLELTGSQYYSTNTTQLIDADLDYFFDSIFFAILQDFADAMYPKVNEEKITIKGVKVSDELNFAQATELDIQLNISNINNNTNFNSSQLKCINSITSTKITTKNDTEDGLPQSLETSSNSFNINFSDDNFFQVDNFTQEGSVSNNITQEFNEEHSWKATNDSLGCLESEQCEMLDFFEQSSPTKIKGHLSTEIEYSTAESSLEYSSLSITVK